MYSAKLKILNVFCIYEPIQQFVVLLTSITLSETVARRPAFLLKKEAPTKFLREQPMAAFSL